jgi:hypothetical protein
MDLVNELQSRSSSIQAALSSTDRAKTNYLEDWRARTGKTFQTKVADYQTKLQVATEKKLGKTELGTQVSTAAPILYGIGTAGYKLQNVTAPLDELAFNKVAEIKARISGQQNAGETPEGYDGIETKPVDVDGGGIEMTDVITPEIRDRGSDLADEASLGNNVQEGVETGVETGLEEGATTVGTESAIELGTGAAIGTELGVEAGAASTGFLAPVAGIALAGTAIAFGLSEIFGGSTPSAPAPVMIGKPPPVMQGRYSISAVLPTRSSVLSRGGGSTNY